METLDFIKVNPAGNMTLLIENYNIFSKNIMEISENIMKETNLYAEQVGFIKDKHLQMMGGEFCGNASRAFAGLIAFRDKNFKEQNNYSITCSGEKEILDVDVRKTEFSNKFLAKIKMPQFIEMKKIQIADNKNLLNDFILVEFSGIHHFIYEGKEKAEKIIKLIKKYVKNLEYSAFGIMFFEEEKMEMKPYVYVKGFENGIWENSCASGTTALGFYLREYKNIKQAKIIQPNGWLEFSFAGKDIFIDGPVEIVATGKVYI